MVPTSHHACVFLSTENVVTLRSIGWYRAALSYEQDIFSELSCRVLAWKAIGCEGSGFGISFFSAKKAELTHRDFAVLPGWADATALPKQILTQLNDPSTFSTEILLELFWLVQSTLQGEEALSAEEKRTLWNPFLNVGVRTVDKRSKDEVIARYTSKTRLLHDYLKEDGGCV